MNRLAWKTLVRKTAWASKKKKLGKRELIALQDAQMAISSLKTAFGLEKK